MYDILIFSIIVIAIVGIRKFLVWRYSRSCWDCKKSAYCIRDNYPTCSSFRRK